MVFPSSHPWQLLGAEDIIHSLVRVLEGDGMKSTKPIQKVLALAGLAAALEQHGAVALRRIV